MEASFYCRASVNYSVAQDQFESCEIDIFNGREASLAWDRNGFQLLEDPIDFDDWDNNKAIRSSYYPHMEALACSLTGSRAAIISAHINRNPEAAGQHPDYGPIHMVHSDFGDDYGEFLKAYYQEDDPFAVAALARHQLSKADIANTNRIMVLQFWRNVGEEELDNPLALVDAETVPREDILQFKMPGYGGNGRAFDAFVVKPDNAQLHRWYTFPKLRRDEVIAIRTFDSDRLGDGRTYWTPHSAFEDPNGREAPPRRSIEVRAICIF